MFVTTPPSPRRTLLFDYFLKERPPFAVTSMLSVLFKNEFIFYCAKKTSCGIIGFLSPGIPDFARSYLFPFMKRFILNTTKKERDLV